MAYRVEFARRAERDLDRLFRRIDAADSSQARTWFNDLESAILSFQDNSDRCPSTPDDETLRHLLHGRGRDLQRVIFRVDEARAVVTVLHISHGALRPTMPPPRRGEPSTRGRFP